MLMFVQLGNYTNCHPLGQNRQGKYTNPLPHSMHHKTGFDSMSTANQLQPANPCLSMHASSRPQQLDPSTSLHWPV
eukprot:1184791-Prorocentrum_lima.AAC.1